MLNKGDLNVNQNNWVYNLCNNQAELIYSMYLYFELAFIFIVLCFHFNFCLSFSYV